MRIPLSALGGAAKLGLFVSALTFTALSARLVTAGFGSASEARTPVKTVAQAHIAPPARPVSPPANLHPDLPPTSAEAINAAVPISTALNPAARPFLLAGSADDRAKALTCLTQAVYYEAGFEPATGEQAVAQVVLNRLRHPIFPHSVCGVVYQGSELKTGCQFSFTCDGALGRKPQPAAWDRAKRVAEQALNGFVMKAVGGATHYHTQWVVPWWRPTVTKVAQIGAHIFYRWQGALGLPQAFTVRYAGAERIAPAAGPRPAALDAGVVVAPKAADGRVHAVLQVADATPPSTPRERMRALAAKGLLGAGFDPAAQPSLTPAASSVQAALTTPAKSLAATPSL
jgi:spore germination cell wall hydrolase CwlJ-like protein